MKKILIVAALLAAVAVPASPSFAAAAMKMPAMKVNAFTCWFMPTNADCQALWKSHMKISMPVMKMPTMPSIKVAAPAMPIMPTCTRAAAGAGHLLDCKM